MKFLSVGPIPNRKRPALSVIDGATVRILAWFTSRDEADEFLRLVKHGLCVPEEAEERDG